jgi:ribonuclease P protein component
VPRFGQTAVARNRLKRRLRELARTRLLPVLVRQLPAVDVVIRPIPPAYAATFDALARQVERAAGQLPKLLARR